MEALRTGTRRHIHATCSINRHHRGAALVEYLLPLLFALLIAIPAWAMYGDAVRQQLANAATKLAENYYHGWFWPVEEQAADGSPARPGSGAEGGPSTGEDRSAGGGSSGGLPGSGNPFAPNPGSDIGNPFAPDPGGAGGDAPLQCGVSGNDSPAMSPVGNTATYTQVGNPIDLGTGNKLQTEHDYRSGRPAGLHFVRYYNSVLGAADTGLGRGWRHSYQRAIIPTDAPDVVTVWRDDGNQYRFMQRDGHWQPPLGVVEQLVPVDDERGTRVGWAYTTADGQVEHYDATGLLLRIDHPLGSVQQLHYGSDGRLLQIADSRGDSISLQWRGTHLHRVTTPDGDRLAYDYDGRLNLVEVIRRSEGLRSLFAGLRTPERRYHYDDERHPHALTGLDDATGQRFASWTYDELGRAVSSEHGDGAEKIMLDYRRPPDATSRERRVTVTNALGHRAIYTLEPARAGRYRLKAIDGRPLLNCAAVAQRHHYDDRGFLVRRYDVDGIGSEYRRDGRGRIVEAQEGLRFDARGQGRPAPGATRIDYRWQGQTPQPHSVTRYGWMTGQGGDAGWQPVIRYDWQRDPRGRLVSEVITDLSPSTEVGVARTTQYRYIDRDAANGERTAPSLQTLEVTDPLGHVTTYHYDRDERLQAIVNALGQRIRFDDFTRSGSPRHIALPDGQQLRLTYNPHGLPTRLTRAGGALSETTRISYDAEGRPVTVERPDGSRDHYRYNAAGQLVERRNGWGERIELTPNRLHGHWETQWRYDADGDPVLRQWRHFNALGQLSSVSHDDGAETRYHYDARGNLIERQEGHENPAQAALARITRGRYDTQHRLLEWLDATGHTTHYGYSASGHIAAITDANGNTTRYRRNGFGEVVHQHSPATGDEWRRHDGNGNLIAKGASAAVLDASDTEPFDGMRFRYDALNRLINVDYPGEADDIAYSYDQSDSEHGNGIGRLTRIETAQQVIDYRYDALGRKIAETTQDKDTEGKTTHTTTLTYRYDTGGRLAAIGYPDGSTVHYRYNNERIASVSWHEAATNRTHTLVKAIDYAPFGGPIAWTYGNGLRRTTELDLQGRVTGIALHKARNRFVFTRDSADTDLIWHQHYHYDLYRSIKQIERRQRADDDTLHSDNRRYRYDAVARLTGEIAEAESAEAQRMAYAYDPVGNRLREVRDDTAAGYEYGPGNRIQRAPDSELWVEQGHTLIEKNPGGVRYLLHDTRGHLRAVQTEQQRLAGYDYDARGWRYRKQVLQADGGVRETRFGYLPTGQLLFEHSRVDAQALPARRYIWLGMQPIAQIDAGAEPIYLHSDHLTTPRLASNPQGQVVWRWDSDAFGSQAPNEDPDGDGHPTRIDLRFPGQYADAETGWYYNLHRYYDPHKGRYTQSDLLGLADGVNSFAYVHNNPLDGIDPLGLYDTLVHYYMTYTLGVAAGLPPQVAYKIAQATQYIDDNPPTSPLSPSGIANGAWGTYHFTLDYDNVHHGDRSDDPLTRFMNPSSAQLDRLYATTNPTLLGDAWNSRYGHMTDGSYCRLPPRAALDDTRYQLYGEYLHAFEDTFAHRDANNVAYRTFSGFQNTPAGGVGHGLAGHRPDRTFNQHYDTSYCTVANPGGRPPRTRRAGVSRAQCEALSTGRWHEHVEDWQYNEMRTLQMEYEVFTRLQSDFAAEIAAHGGNRATWEQLAGTAPARTGADASLGDPDSVLQLFNSLNEEMLRSNDKPGGISDKLSELRNWLLANDFTEAATRNLTIEVNRVNVETGDLETQEISVDPWAWEPAIMVERENSESHGSYGKSQGRDIRSNTLHWLPSDEGGFNHIILPRGA